MQRTAASRSVSGGSFADLNEDLLGDETLVAYAAAAGTTAADGRGRNLGDEFDLFVFHNEFRVDSQESGTSVRPHYGNTRAEGTGIPWNFGVPCGEGRLKAVWYRPVWMRSFNVYAASAPENRRFDAGLLLFAHEFAHAWTAHASYDRNGTPEPLFGNYCRCHWRWDLHLPAAFPWHADEAGPVSLMGGRYWRDHGDGTFTPINGYHGGGHSWLDTTTAAGRLDRTRECRCHRSISMTSAQRALTSLQLASPATNRNPAITASTRPRSRAIRSDSTPRPGPPADAAARGRQTCRAATRTGGYRLGCTSDLWAAVSCGGVSSFPEAFEAAAEEQQRRARMASAPVTDQCIPVRLRRAPMACLHPASTTPVATHRPLARNAGFRSKRGFSGWHYLRDGGTDPRWSNRSSRRTSARSRR